MARVLTICLSAAGVTALGAIALFALGCMLHRPAPALTPAAEGSDELTVADDRRPIVEADANPNEDRSAAASQAPSAARPTTEPVASEPVLAVRAGGDLAATTTFANGVYRSGSARIPTPLPEGYPPPTPPGAVELKRYPLVRRAGIGGSIMPDWGMNLAFFPLFNHIKRREIAMTSPVEMNYEGLGEAGAKQPEEWTMSFLYRTPEQGPDGPDPEDDRILVEDVAPMTVVAIGMQGAYRVASVNTGIESLRAWLASQSEWREAGDPRALFYNGPETPRRDQWFEVQLPVVRATPAAD